MSVDEDERSPWGGQQPASVVETSSAPTRLRALDPAQATQPMDGPDPERAPGPSPSTPRTFQEGEVVCERFTVLRFIAGGGMGEVYEALDGVLQTHLALKTIRLDVAAHPLALQRFHTEVLLARRVTHPNVCRVFEFFPAKRPDGRSIHFLTMELLQGETLADLLHREGKLSAEQALPLLRQVASGLSAAHAEGVIHRDLKASNVFLIRRSAATAQTPVRVVLTDFGIARALMQTDGLNGPVVDRTIIGTPGYMSPEQLVGGRISPATDVYAFGVVLFEMLTGELPFRTEGPLPRALQGLAPDLPAGWTQTVLRCLEAEPARRFQSALEVMQALDPQSVSAAAAPPRHSVAVLPFADRSPERNQQFLCEGVSEEILDALGRIPKLQVVARTSSFRLAQSDIAPKEIGRQLGATLLVTGSVRKSNERLRVSAQLVEAETGYERWSEIFDRMSGDLFTIQQEIAAAVTRSLSRQLAAVSPSAGRPTDVEAYEWYLQGRFLWNRRPGAVVWEALACFQKAAQRDARFAAAWAGVADVYATLGSWEAGVLPHDEAHGKAKEFATRALEIDPELAEAHTTLAYTTLHHDWNAPQSEASFLRALALNPNLASAHHWYSHCLAATGRFEQSLEESRVAQALDPLNPLMTAHLAWHYHMAGAPEHVLEQAERTIRIDSQFHFGHYFAGWGAEALGDAARAVSYMREAVRCSSGQAVMVAGLGRALACAGERRPALDVVRDLEKRGGEHCLYAYEIALIHLALGETEAALALLERARAERSGWLTYLAVDPRLGPLRGQERFEKLRPQGIRLVPPLPR